MTTHVFIVNENTFPVHLEYMFAGTSSGKRNWNTSLLADIKRVRAHDKVIFYFEGIGFYGIFRIKDNRDQQGKQIVYYDKDNYCDGRLGKKLLYRVLIEPDQVFAKPVSEWDALERLPDDPRDMIWSLIYRKLRARRGCTPITPRESNKLTALIREANQGNHLEVNEREGYSWDGGQIVRTSHPTREYDTSRADIPDVEQMMYRNRRTEAYLQAYFTENAGLETFDNTGLSAICGESGKVRWIGNEVFCGVGMQKIDILTITQNQQRQFRVIELKAKLDPNVLNIPYQLERYVNWCLDYLAKPGNGVTPLNLNPITVMPTPSKTREVDLVTQLCEESLPEFNRTNEDKCRPVKYFEYDFDSDKRLVFTERKCQRP